LTAPGRAGILPPAAGFQRSPEVKEGAMKVESQKEHRWLERLVGEWTFESEAIMGPGQEPVKSTGSQSTHSIGGLWVQSDGTCEMPGGGPTTMVITLGYDTAKKRFVGTFIGSMMTNLWVYDGAGRGRADAGR
jgi:Protein of unknown function (DUF1579)